MAEEAEVVDAIVADPGWLGPLEERCESASKENKDNGKNIQLKKK